MIDWPQLIETCAPDVAPATMQALVKVESGFRSHAIGYKVVAADGKVYFLERQPRSQREAIDWATWLLNNRYRFDAGAGQINSVNFARFNLSAANVFDACTNLFIASKILSECFVNARRSRANPQAALQAALSCYNSGNFRTGLANGYVARVARASPGHTPLAAGVSSPPLVPALHGSVPAASPRPEARTNGDALRSSSEVAAFSKAGNAPQPGTSAWADPSVMTQDWLSGFSGGDAIEPRATGGR